MTRSDLIHKWLTYALGMFPIWLLDAYILPRYPIHGVTPMLLPLAVVSVAVLEGAYAGVGFGMSVGLLWALSYPGGAGGLVIGMALTGLATGAVSQYVLNQSYPGCLVCSAGALAALDGVRILGWLVTERATLPAMLRVAGSEILLSLVWSPVVWLIFRSVYKRVGGSRLA